MQTSRSWAEWSPRLVAAIVEALPLRQNLEKQEVNGEQAEMKKMDAAAWKKHVAMQHRPYRRDCRRCLKMMGSDGHHRQTPGDRAGYCLSLDIVGPMPICDDVGLAPGNGIPPKAKYLMGATVAIPRIKMETEEEPKVVLGVAEDTTLPKLDVVDDEPAEMVSEEEVKALNQKWLGHVKELLEPVGMQNLTLVEPMKSRHQDEVVKVASKLYCGYRAMGVAQLRIYTDRETAFLSQQFQAWCRKMVVWQTMTGRDGGPSNGRIESEVQQAKRRLRMLVRESGLGERFWPGIARYMWGKSACKVSCSRWVCQRSHCFPSGRRSR